MNCNEFRKLLNQYIDGELNEEEISLLNAHAAECEDCAFELQAAKFMMMEMPDLDEETVVPLETQAAWRRAVRAKAKGSRRKFPLRVGYAIAAALVVAVGCTAIFKSDIAAPSMMQNKAVMPLAENSMIVESDGVESHEVSDTYAAERKYNVNDLDSAKSEIIDLCDEYEATYSVSDDGKSGACVFLIDFNDADPTSFLSAAARIGDITVDLRDNSITDSIVVRIELNKI